MNKIPEIWGISLKNYKLMVDNMNQKHIIGDIYYDGNCVGYYNPIYQATPESQPEYFVKLEDSEFRAKFSAYRSIYDYAGKEKYINDDTIIFRGLNVLLEDLERLIVMYECVKGAQEENRYCRIIGVINDNIMKVYPFMKLPVDNNGEPIDDIIEFIEDKTGMFFDAEYPVLKFETEDDFIFRKPVILQ